MFTTEEMNDKMKKEAEKNDIKPVLYPKGSPYDKA